MILEYIWIDGNYNLRSKYNTINDQIEVSLSNIPIWNYDGSSTYQSDTHNSEIVLVPVSFFKNPFFVTIQSYLVLCDTYVRNEMNELMATNTNNRYNANLTFNKLLDESPWFGIEQEYFMMGENNCPLFMKNGEMKEQGNYYCGVGSKNVSHRKLAEKHYEYCINAGLTISGINAEVAPNQWEFQIGPVEGIWASDHLWVARYILHKLSEEFNIVISFNPKPLVSPWNGSGLHTNFSTISTRTGNGFSTIMNYIEKLGKLHGALMTSNVHYYGDNSQRLSGLCETSDPDFFTYGIGSRNTSVRIPKQVAINGYGYFEDRRPASNADPYLVTSLIFQSCCL